METERGNYMIMDRLAAAGFDIHFFEAEALVAALDYSGDLPPGVGMEAFNDLMIMKYQEIPARLHDDLDVMGIESPVLIDIEPNGEWYFTDGHHRLSWALVRRRHVPVLFIDEATDPLHVWNILAEGEVDYDYA